MNVQVFRGRTLKEAQRAAVQLLGSDAVVLTTRTVRRSGMSGWFGGSEVEVAAIGAQAEDAADARPAGVAKRFAPGVYATPSAREAANDIAALRAELKGDIRALKSLVARAEDSSALASELNGLRELIEGLGGTTGKGDRWTARLRSLGVEGAPGNALARALKGKPVDTQTLRDELSHLLKACAWPVESQRSLVALVGPSGVGKTTTAAKLAARARAEGRSVMLVGCDTFRVGATEQLSRYAVLMDAEFATARTADDLAGVLEDSRADMVVVDTSGRPPSPESVETALVPAAIRSTRALARTRHVLLCAQASIRAVDAAAMAKRYGVLTPTSLVVTKLDETNAPAGIVHARWATKLPISVLCFGPRVPEDVAPATMGAILDTLAPAGDKVASA